MSPADGQVYVSDAEKYRVVRVLSLNDVTDPSANYEVVAGNGERCIPGDYILHSIYLFSISYSFKFNISAIVWTI